MSIPDSTVFLDISQLHGLSHWRDEIGAEGAKIPPRPAHAYAVQKRGSQKERGCQSRSIFSSFSIVFVPSLSAVRARWKNKALHASETGIRK